MKPPRASSREWESPSHLDSAMENSYQPCLVTQRLNLSLWSLCSPTARVNWPSMLLQATAIWSHLHDELGESWALLLPKCPDLSRQFGEKAAVAVQVPGHLLGCTGCSWGAQHCSSLISHKRTTKVPSSCKGSCQQEHACSSFLSVF